LWKSNHIFSKPIANKHCCVDAAGIDLRDKCLTRVDLDEFSRKDSQSHSIRHLAEKGRKLTRSELRRDELWIYGSFHVPFKPGIRKNTVKGWVNYFRLANIYGKLRDIDEWVRRRLRRCIWQNWKKPDRKMKNLIRLGINPGMAYAWGRTRMGGWAVACSSILGTTITLERLGKRKYISLLSYYLEMTRG
jgi:hypothetical protein